MSMFDSTFHSVSREIAGRTLTLETGKIARQANSITVRYGDGITFVAVCDGGIREGLDFFPLTCDYREKTYAAGKIPGGFFKREGRPTTKEVLTCRLMDRPLRPNFPDGFKNEVSVCALVLSADADIDPDIPAMIGAMTALYISEIPFDGPIAAVRMGMVGGELVPMPSYFEVETGELDLVVAAKKDAIAMVECGAKEVSEDAMVEALFKAQEVCTEIIGMMEELREKCGKEKKAFEVPAEPTELAASLAAEYGARLEEAHFTLGKLTRKKALGAVFDDAKEKHLAGIEDRFELKDKTKELKKAWGMVLREIFRRNTSVGKRLDNRGTDEIRDIECEVGILPRSHGSALFTRGETQSLVACTLGTEFDSERLDGIREEKRRRFYLHYNFPAFCVGEAWPNRGPKRREIGHGALAERSIIPVLPDFESFPYTVRIVSDVMESNGSSSMATVTGATLALMDAGVPIKRPVAGIAMGMVKEGDDIAILTDISGSEDHDGDMDFKVAGTQAGITALQMDIKMKGLDAKVMARALEQAKQARFSILRTMLAALPKPRPTVSVHAPKIVMVPISGEKVGNLIGPGGKTIRRLQEETGTSIDINDQMGYVTVAAWGPANLDEAVRIVRALTEEIEVGSVYRGRVISVKDFGAFIEILPGQEGLLHVSEMSYEYISDVSQICELGDSIEVAVVGIDPAGRIRLSRKPLLTKPEDDGGRGRGRGRGRDEPRDDAADTTDAGSDSGDASEADAETKTTDDAEPAMVGDAFDDDADGDDFEDDDEE